MAGATDVIGVRAGPGTYQEAENAELKVGPKSGSFRSKNVENKRLWPLFQRLFQALRGGIVFEVLIAHDAHAHVVHAGCSTRSTCCSTCSPCSRATHAHHAHI